MLGLPLNPQIAQTCLIIMQNVFLLSLSSSQSLPRYRTMALYCISLHSLLFLLLFTAYLILQKQEQVSESAVSSLSKFSDEEEAELSFGAAQSELDPFVHEDMLKDCSDLENPFRASPLSNRERLILRKQALKMKKRPVLAVGNNIYGNNLNPCIHVLPLFFEVTDGLLL